MNVFINKYMYTNRYFGYRVREIEIDVFCKVLKWLKQRQKEMLSLDLVYMSCIISNTQNMELKYRLS